MAHTRASIRAAGALAQKEGILTCTKIRTGLAQSVRRRARVLETRVRIREAGHYRVRLDNRIGRISNRMDCNW